jgi:hypothetical protein
MESSSGQDIRYPAAKSSGRSKIFGGNWQDRRAWSAGEEARTTPQCVEGLSSLLPVENKIDTRNTAMIAGTTTKGEEMCIVQASLVS